MRTEQLGKSLIGNVMEQLKALDDAKLLKDFSMSRFLQAVLKFITECNLSLLPSQGAANAYSCPTPPLPCTDKLEEHYSFYTYIFEKFLSESEKFKSLEEAKGTLMDHADAHRILKGLIANSDKADDKCKEVIMANVRQMLDKIKSHFAVLVQTKAVYVILSIVEHTQYKNEVSSASISPAQAAAAPCPWLAPASDSAIGEGGKMGRWRRWESGKMGKWRRWESGESGKVGRWRRRRKDEALRH